MVATPEGEVLAVYKSGDWANEDGDPNLLYARRTTAGVWTDHTVVRNRFGPSDVDEYSRPRVQYDASNDRVAAADRLDERRVHVFASPRTSPDFAADEPAVAVLESDAAVRNPTVAAQPLGTDSGLLVLARDDSSWWGLHVPADAAAPQADDPPRCDDSA